MRRAREQEPPENHERWLITYADMITLLMVFFIVMYAGSIADADRFLDLATGLQRAFNIDVLKGHDFTATTRQAGNAGTLMESIRKDMETLRKEVDVLRQPGISAGGVEIGPNREGLLVSLYGNMLFDSGKATLKDDALPVLERLGKTLSSFQGQVRVEGHTDDIPIETPLYQSNWELSTARATAVVRYLLDRGMAPDHVQAVGYGETRPRGSNITREGRARNRRVDLQLVYPGALQTLTPADIVAIQVTEGGP